MEGQSRHLLSNSRPNCICLCYLVQWPNMVRSVLRTRQILTKCWTRCDFFACNHVSEARRKMTGQSNWVLQLGDSELPGGSHQESDAERTLNFLDSSVQGRKAARHVIPTSDSLREPLCPFAQYQDFRGDRASRWQRKLLPPSSPGGP